MTEPDSVAYPEAAHWRPASVRPLTPLACNPLAITSLELRDLSG